MLSRAHAKRLPTGFVQVALSEVDTDGTVVTAPARSRFLCSPRLSCAVSQFAAPWGWQTGKLAKTCAKSLAVCLYQGISFYHAPLGLRGCATRGALRAHRSSSARGRCGPRHRIALLVRLVPLSTCGINSEYVSTDWHRRIGLLDRMEAPVSNGRRETVGKNESRPLRGRLCELDAG